MLTAASIAVVIAVATKPSSGLDFAGAPMLVVYGLILLGALCFLAALRDWPFPFARQASAPDANQGSNHGTTVVRVRNSKNVTNIGNVGHGTGSVIDAEGVKGLANIDNRLLEPPKTPTDDPDPPTEG
jgi:hypothetical protein